MAVIEAIEMWLDASLGTIGLYAGCPVIPAFP